MLHGRTICLGVLCVFFIPSVVFAQSQSATETIIEKIYQSEMRVREHVDKKVEGIETKISAVDTKVETLSTKFGTLSTDVAVNKTNITNMQNNIDKLEGKADLILSGIVVILISIVGYFVKSWLQNRGKTDNVDVADHLNEQITKLISAQAEQIAKLTSAQAEAQAEISAQITRFISAQTEISATKGVPGDPKVPSVERLDEGTDDIRSQQRDTEERV